MNRDSFRLVDMYCGAGGSTAGAEEAANFVGLKCELSVWNHWAVAIETHKTNHPAARHYCENLNNVNPRDHYPKNSLHALWASPSCSYHSVAAGGRPKDLNQSRADPWTVVRWIDETRPDLIFAENVPEIISWGPLNAKGRPIQSRKGQIFNAWFDTIRSLGYKIDYRILCSADYGDPTTRRRFFLLGARGNRKIVWPNPTHLPEPATDLFGNTHQKWVPARSIINFKIKGKSIYHRKHPLKPNTLARIEAGLRKFGLNPFLIQPGHANTKAKTTVTDRAPWNNLSARCPAGIDSR